MIQEMIGWWENTKPTTLEQVHFASDPEADNLIKGNVTAFAIAAALDRRGRAMDIWNVPLGLQRRWGHLDTARIRQMNPEEVANFPEIQEVPAQVSKFHLGKTIVDLAEVVQRDCHGDANALFGGTFKEILGRLDGIFGIGPGIARMMVILRMLYFGLQPEPGGELLPKLDTHVQRVFYRTGTVTRCTDAEVRHALRGCDYRQIAMLDQAAWCLGQDFCWSRQPRCHECPIQGACPKRGIG